jgi:hypothetical protein
MVETQQQNILYLAVLPLVHITAIVEGIEGQPLPLHGEAGQTVTLFADRNLATEFFPDEVDVFLGFFKKIADSQLTGGHVKGYKYEKEKAANGRVVVKVTQYVE